MSYEISINIQGNNLEINYPEDLINKLEEEKIKYSLENDHILIENKKNKVKITCPKYAQRIYLCSDIVFSILGRDQSSVDIIYNGKEVLSIKKLIKNNIPIDPYNALLEKDLYKTLYKINKTGEMIWVDHSDIKYGFYTLVNLFCRVFNE